MKTILHKITAITMACVVIFTTMSFTVDMHYCGDILVDVALFKDAKDCGMGMAMAQSSSDMKEMSCCHNEQIVIKGQDELKHSLQKISLEQQQFLVAFYDSYIHLFEISAPQAIPFDGYPPPDIVSDLTILHEQFLI
ncbi:hypothetical protein [Dokdonia sp.]|uniref:HYC_CC_PP family protein n=1 Tax=Dokdonia sp. TaxID=2024995 RepID=UPI00326799B3